MITNQEIKDKVDDELIGQIAAGLIVGIPSTEVSREEARRLKPELSSLNPSRVWTRTQQEAMGTKGIMEDAYEYYVELLLPAAEDALIDQEKKLGTKTCQFPASPFAASWVKWCVENIKSMEINMDEQVYNLDGYNLWEIGEISTGIIKKRIAVKTTYEGGNEVLHYYPETNWRE